MLASLEVENQKEIEAILSEAKAHAERTIETARREGEAVAAEETKRGEDIAKQEVRSISSRALAESRRNLASARAEVYAEVVAEILKKASSLRERPDHRSVIEGLVREALEEVPSDTPAVIICDPRDRDDIDHIMSSLGRSLAVRTTNIELGGIMVELSDGRVRIDNTLETRIMSVIEAQRPKLGEILFGATNSVSPVKETASSGTSSHKTEEA